MGSNVPGGVRQVVAMKCGDCHSDNTRWPLYSRVAPISWMVEHDVHEGRTTMNLSHWEAYGTETQIDLLTRIAAEARSGEMPLKSYVRVHPEMRLSTAEQELLYHWAKSERMRLKSQIAKKAERVAGIGEE